MEANTPPSNDGQLTRPEAEDHKELTETTNPLASEANFGIVTNSRDASIPTQEAHARPNPSPAVEMQETQSPATKDVLLKGAEIAEACASTATTMDKVPRPSSPPTSTRDGPDPAADPVVPWIKTLNPNVASSSAAPLDAAGPSTDMAAKQNEMDVATSSLMERLVAKAQKIPQKAFDVAADRAQTAERAKADVDEGGDDYPSFGGPLPKALQSLVMEVADVLAYRYTDGKHQYMVKCKGADQRENWLDAHHLITWARELKRFHLRRSEPVPSLPFLVADNAMDFSNVQTAACLYFFARRSGSKEFPGQAKSVYLYDNKTQDERRCLTGRGG